MTKFAKNAAAVASAVCLGVLVMNLAAAKEKPAQDTDKTVDSGSFGVFNGGQRVASETFSIRQGATGSTISSQFKSAQGEQRAEQSSDLELAPSGDLRSYDWKEMAPEKGVASVTPDGTFLVERFGDGPEAKQNVQNFLLPPSTAILDDYAFVQREVLAWKYLAMACKHDQGAPRCPKDQKMHFGALNPHERSSMSVSIEFAGRDKITWRGAEHEFSHFVLSSETGDWSFWLDDDMKLVQLVSDGGVEVVRD